MILYFLLTIMILCDVVVIVTLYVLVKGFNRELHCLRERVNRVEKTAELARQTAYIARRSLD